MDYIGLYWSGIFCKTGFMNYISLCWSVSVMDSGEILGRQTSYVNTTAAGGVSGEV